MIDTLSNSVLQNVPYNTDPYNTVPYNTFLNFIHPAFIQDQPASATHQANLSSVILAQCEGKKWTGEVGDILEGPEYKVHLECPVQH